jgi:pyruvate dehydrogenase E2 component (dihydrolipoamide acetyltransferase)
VYSIAAHDARFVAAREHMRTILMPRLSDSMEEGVIVRWLQAEGYPVAVGDELVEIETDKATVSYEADAEGILHHAVGVGTTVAVGELIAWIRDPHEDPPRVEAGPEPTSIATAGERGPAAGLKTVATDGRTSAERINASPVARRIARDAGIELGNLDGSGPRGRIVKSDVESVIAAEPEAHQPVGLAPREHGTRGEPRLQQLSRTQLTVSRRMAESRATVPDFELRLEIDMTRSVRLRDELKELSDPAPSFNDLIVRAVALALREFPRVNGAYRDGGWELYPRVNVGIAVAGAETLVVPIILDADMKSVTPIAGEARELSAKVRDGSITPADLAGGTFTVSNLGMYGIDSFSAVINAPQSAILAVGAVKHKPVADETGCVTARPMMTVNLSCDHRIIYGADGAQFLARVRTLLERPLALAV